MDQNGWRDGMWPRLSTPGAANVEQRRDRSHIRIRLRNARPRETNERRIRQNQTS